MRRNFSGDAYASAVISDGPVGYWRLNEQSPGDHVTDESGFNHHGRFVGNQFQSEPGAIAGSANRSIRFVPETHVEIPHSDHFNIQTSGQGLSVEVWFKPAVFAYSGEGGKKYIHWLGKGSPRKMEWGFRLYSSDHAQRPRRISAYAWNPQGGEGAGAYLDGARVHEGEWIHLVACFQHYVHPCAGMTGVQLYVNGAIVPGPPSRGTLYFNEGYWSVVPRRGDAPLRFATRSASTGSFLNGLLDEVAIYPKVLTPEQVRQHYDLATTNEKRLPEEGPWKPQV